MIQRCVSRGRSFLLYQYGKKVDGARYDRGRHHNNLALRGGREETKMDSYQALIIVTSALTKLVIIATLLERGLAFIFEYEWFIRLTTKEVPDPNDNTKKIRENRIPGLKGFIALLGAYLVCNKYGFDVLFTIFNPGAASPQADRLGIMLTSLIVSGGSAGAILVFQGYLNLSKQGRDAVIDAKKAAAAPQP
jgi:hypothetical protein